MDLLIMQVNELAQQVFDYVQAASRPIQCTVGAAGCLITAYGAYCLWFYGGTRRVRSKVTLKGQTVIITGANAGIGRETAIELARRGARVIMGCRNMEAGMKALADVRRRSGNLDVVLRELDLCDLNSVRDFAELILREEDHLDILINNAGIALAPSTLSPEGFDLMMATNHVGHFLLTLMLVDLLMKSAPSRIVNVSSNAHFSVKSVDFANKSGKAVPFLMLYCRSKLANVIFSRELARRLVGSGVTAYSLHPGVIFTSIWQNMTTAIGKKVICYVFYPLLWLCTLSEKAGAQTTIYCAIEESVTHLSGGFFANCRLAKESNLAMDENLAKQLWDVSCEATGVDPNKLVSQ